MGKTNHETILQILRKKYGGYMSNAKAFRMWNLEGEQEHFIVDFDRGVITNSCSHQINSILKKVHDREDFTLAKIVIVRQKVVLLLSKKNIPGHSVRKLENHRAEIFGLPNMMPSFLSNISTHYNTLKRTASGVISTLTDYDLRYIIIDMMTLLVVIRDGDFTPTKFLTTLLTVLTLSARSRLLCAKHFPRSYPQSGLGLSVNDLALAFSALGVPSEIIEKLKIFMLLTGKRITECTALINLMTKFITLVLSIVDSVIDKLPENIVLRTLRNVISDVAEYFILNDKLRRITEYYTQYVKDPQVMFDPVYRLNVLALSDEVSSDAQFQAYIANTSNKYAGIVWKAFSANVVKYARTYDVSSRVEPICLVFDGPAGCGKTGLLNKFSQVLKAANRSIYVHTCPPVEGGKDFYDDYNNEDIMIMDDVGQQGVSQWRTIINFVSPVKYPLPCAVAENKNTKFFNSKIILCTTNNFEHLGGFTKSDCISTPEALFRRVHLIKVTADGKEGEFTQQLEYKKYDHKVSKVWESRFLHENSGITLPTLLSKTKGVEGLKWIYAMLRDLESCRSVNETSMVLSDDQLQDIIGAAERREESEVANPSWGRLDSVLSDATFIHDMSGFVPQSKIDMILDNVAHSYEVFKEWVEYFSAVAMRHVTNSLAGIVDNDVGKGALAVLAGAFTIFVGKYVYDQYFTRVEATTSMVEAWGKKIDDVKGGLSKYSRQSGVNEEIPEYILQLKRHSKVIAYKENGVEIFTHAIVSGENLLVPSHATLSGVFIDIYNSWEHIRNKHKEAEAVQLELVKEYISSDIAVYKFVQFPVLYKKLRTLFTPSTTKSPFVYMILGDEVIKMLKGKHVQYNFEEIFYTSGRNEYTHPVHTGWTTPLSAAGFCGAMLVDAAGVVIGFHVSGNESSGFSVIPSQYVIEDLTRLMNTGAELEFELDSKVIPGFSGVRMRYETGEIAKKYPVTKTSLIPTVLHIDYNPQTDELIRNVGGVDKKGPPLIQGPIATLERIAKKTFIHQGEISDAEAKHIENTINQFIPDFEEITWQEVVRGNSDLPSINMESSNGYNMVPGKTVYIDYEEGDLTALAYEAIEGFRNKCESGEVDVASVLSQESIKDELRVESKRSEPRTFRIMPVTHMLWSKKIFGNLASHIKKEMHETGICIGFNPYKDFDVLAHKLRTQEVVCDADFKKWDGSLIARIMKIVSSIFSRRYKGNNRAVLDELMKSTYNSTVLVYDAVYRTTHGMPSGTWLTLLLNCLYNKALSALVLYRNGCQDPKDIYNIVDYVTGDDKICGASGKYAKAFNAFTIRDVAASLGMECTNGDKSMIVKESQEFSKLNYLKRDFVFHNSIGRWMGCLSKTTILNTIQWIDNTKEFEVAMEGKLRSMQVESYLHGPQFYKSYCELVRRAFPHFSWFTEKRIMEIFEEEDGYRQTCLRAGKDVSWLF